MDLGLIMTAIGGLGIGGAIVGIRDWRANKKGAEVTVKKEDYEAQKTGLDLVSEFYEKVKALTAEGNDIIKIEIKSLHEDVRDIKEEQKTICEFLNGDYKKYKNGKSKDRTTSK